MLTPKVTALMSSIRAGEDTELELKEVVFRGDRVSFASEEGRATPKLAEVFVSMANTRGGTVVMGVRDVHQTSDGRCLQRLGSHRRLIPPERLARLLSARRLASPMEERPAVGSSPDDLDGYRLKKYFRSRFRDWSPPDEWAPVLAAHKLAVLTDAGPVPTHLGILLFAEQPEQHVHGAYIDVASYRHDTPDGNTADSERITGPLPEQIARALTYLRVSPLNPTLSRKDGGGRHDYPSYSDRAVQEAIVNAVVHRDYDIGGSQIIIRLLPDHIEFRNPGALCNTLTVENLYAGC